MIGMNRKYINKEKVHGRSQILSYHLVKSGISDVYVWRC
ncbi:hypothetical protein D917_00536 [Trichinella nativa]|uniref:Uncharacterized protein n=1 Tax=Trichinella nativa TaxID=6335 RepID=A0A1Y3E7C0_9BILA|nr:hypothetical protein D917_00536 [Trichinella nativa]